jgi:hypothetical protein
MSKKLSVFPLFIYFWFKFLWMGAWGTKDKYILNFNSQKTIAGNIVALMTIA